MAVVSYMPSDGLGRELSCLPISTLTDLADLIVYNWLLTILVDKSTRGNEDAVLQGRMIGVSALEQVTIVPVTDLQLGKGYQRTSNLRVVT